MNKTSQFSTPALAYSLKEAASIIGLGDRKFHQEVLDGKIDVVRIGKRRLITLEAINIYLEKNTVKAIDAASFAKNILESSAASPKKKKNKK